MLTYDIAGTGENKSVEREGRSYQNPALLCRLTAAIFTMNFVSTP